MEYLLLFLEGIITFISPCLLPMLPIYISYFAGQGSEDKKQKALTNALAFVLGFTLVFITLGAFAGTVGNVLRQYSTGVNIASGLIVILFGLNFLGVLRIPFLNRYRQLEANVVKLGFFSSLLFGIIFSIGWTPCVGAFLGSALMFAASEGGTLKGVIMLLCFSLGLGIPFIASAVLIDRLKSTLDFIKRNYRLINLFSGGLLVIVGILMATGLMGYFLGLLS
ncbi:cytochrome c biogenesis protein [Desulfitobacterium dichloroeliminans LMG P-21439]|uniref:Cytochrome c biogenesis protein n=1 Tax=Desulfitobacterium dichloroeliminans (strain LMG P-21439 / DCA1) TaxID=871963 RepID=L0F7Z3_DESDL|nr:cytochrome c biogenesis protein CcdA [Desulfitobacterium dichloroeliminans]AGA69043.1 cytochrome c biogenesis protein [Desulfitobacterium dichloroeliminans LMG P-21439]